MAELSLTYLLAAVASAWVILAKHWAVHDAKFHQLYDPTDQLQFWTAITQLSSAFWVSGSWCRTVPTQQNPHCPSRMSRRPGLKYFSASWVARQTLFAAATLFISTPPGETSAVPVPFHLTWPIVQHLGPLPSFSSTDLAKPSPSARNVSSQPGSQLQNVTPHTVSELGRLLQQP